MRSKSAAEWAREFSAAPAAPPEFGEGLARRAETFWPCLQCTTCTSVCPVVAVSTDSVSGLDLTPQQIMNLLRLGMVAHALGAGMVWSCTTCYQCSEHCPQNIPVADVLFELRNLAAARLNGPDKGGGA